MRIQTVTTAEFFTLPEDNGQRVELVDGALVVSPCAGGRHQRLVTRLVIDLDQAVPGEFEVLVGVNVKLNAQRVVIPDAVVTNAPGHDALYYDAADMAVVVEVMSPSSRSFDKAHKMALFAEARIPFYLLVDPAVRPAAATLYRLVGSDYAPVAISSDGWLRSTEPFPIDLKLD
ncbi:Uma2 family endonuclease [Actinokineospora sp. NBRC 105648]|uniref:Uma2 family endonuclease n=1 Tax=Actinokineospora sp. NBRC 105648 TaxID=3032206 RepID=UPI0024A28EB3|nr:Uma2 family endonuclease [Actinokineospora sp. NBRC 105648]GLZ39432.1 hypothetical protein Acsp05_30560 [Actinokineospora sp. NBRC 105648]